jgi:hypothetical protein
MIRTRCLVHVLAIDITELCGDYHRCGDMQMIFNYASNKHG